MTDMKDQCLPRETEASGSDESSWEFVMAREWFHVKRGRHPQQFCGSP